MTPNLILAVGLIQGWLAFLLVEAVEFYPWPFVVAVPLFSIVGFLPLFIELSVDELKDRSYWKVISVMAAALAVAGAWTGASVLPDRSQADSVVVPFVLSAGLAGLLLLAYVRAWRASRTWPVPYPDLVKQAWDGTVVLAVAGAFTGAAWALLGVWTGLLSVIKLPLLANFLFQPETFLLITPAILAFAVLQARRRESVVAAVRDLLLAVFARLLPLLAVLVVTFLACLPFTGLELLWKTGHATALMLALQAALLMLVNAAYHDGSQEPPYGTFVRRLVDAAIAAMPVFSALCVYACALRVGQHGWTTSRVYGAAIVGLASAASAGYAFHAVRGRRLWLEGLGAFNMRLGLAALAFALALQTPALDPRAISVRSQLGRLASGVVPPNKFDFSYLRFHLGRKGLEAVEGLQKSPDAATARLATAAVRASTPWNVKDVVSQEDLDKRLRLHPEGRRLPSGLAAYLLASSEYPVESCVKRGSAPLPALAEDLDGDGKDEYVFFCDGTSSALVVAPEGAGWRALRETRLEPKPEAPAKRPAPRRNFAPTLEQNLREGDYEPAPPRYMVLRVGDYILTPGR